MRAEAAAHDGESLVRSRILPLLAAYRSFGQFSSLFARRKART